MCSFLCPLRCTIPFCLCNILLSFMHFIISFVFFTVSLLLLFFVCLMHCIIGGGAAAGGGPWEPSQPEEGRRAPPGLVIYNIWVNFPRTGKMVKMWHFFIFCGFAVTKRFDLFNCSQLFWRDFDSCILEMFLFWS